MTEQYPQGRVLSERSLAVWTRAGDPVGAYHLYTYKPEQAMFTVQRLGRAGNVSNAARRAGAGADLPPGTYSTYVMVDQVPVTDPATMIEQMKADAERRFDGLAWMDLPIASVRQDDY